ncbi:MAG TPA: DinB family protein [candidate division Zixibacteria bacterium]|nr:DinB family protein [candidate division Zixibacteria bacterium]
MDKNLKKIIWNQLGAAIDSLELAIKMCPEKVWGDRSGYHEFWYMVYHTLFFLDYYLSDTDKGFKPPKPFTLGELDPAGVLPDRVYTKRELLRYLEFGRRKARKKLKAITNQKLFKRCGFERKDFTVAELMIYNTRHVQHHMAQLNLLLRKKINNAPKWVSKTKLKL